MRNKRVKVSILKDPNLYKFFCKKYIYCNKFDFSKDKLEVKVFYSTRYLGHIEPSCAFYSYDSLNSLEQIKAVSNTLETSFRTGGYYALQYIEVKVTKGE